MKTVVMSGDKAYFFTRQGMGNGEPCPALVTTVCEVWGIYSTS